MQSSYLQVGKEDTQAQLQLQLTYHENQWAMLEPDEGRWQHGLPLQMTRTLKRRYYLVEKAKNARVIGEQIECACSKPFPASRHSLFITFTLTHYALPNFASRRKQHEGVYTTYYARLSSTAVQLILQIVDCKQ